MSHEARRRDAGATRRGRLRRIALAASAAVAVVVAGCALFIALPLPSDLLERKRASSVIITDREGGVLRELRGADGRSVPLEGDRVPPWVRAAFIAAEDQRYGAHVGVDVRSIARAARDSVAAGRIVSGASTIPQQLARRLVHRERTLFGKLREGLWAMRLVAHLDDDALLVEYLNRVPLGRGAVGVESASATFFGRPARSLSLGQAALLAGLAHAPAREDPFTHPERALARRDFVLSRMEKLGLADAAAVAVARLEPLDLVDASVTEERGRAAHFVEQLVASLSARGLADAVSIRTTIDARVQRAAERIVSEELAGPLAEAGVGNAAVIVIDNESGAVLAYVGSRDFFDQRRLGANDGVRAPRQPGSALKPFVYGMAIEKRGMTPATILPDVEITLATESGTYSPRNYDKRVHGPVRLRAALQSSYNIPAVHVGELLGPRRVVDGLRAAGFDSLDESPEHYGVGVVLGNGDVTLYELARAYRGLARGGVVSGLVDVAAATAADGGSLSVASAFAPRRFLRADAAALLTDVLIDNESRAPAFGIDNALSFAFPVAAKTGTSRAYVDNWTAGFTKERTVAVWAGNFDGTPMRRVSGITGAGVIFRRVMLEAMRDVPDPAPLVDAGQFESARICPFSGLRASPTCPSSFEEHFLPGTVPVESCHTHVHRAPTHADCAVAASGAAGERERALDVEPRYSAWARAEGLPLAADGVVCSPRPAAQPDGKARLLSPRDGDEFVVEPGIPSGQGVPIKIAAPGAERVEVRTGARSLTLAPPFSTWIDAEPGAHRVAVYVDGELVDEARFVVH